MSYTTLTETYEALRPMGVPLERIHLYQNDTLYCPQTGPAAASRSHYFAGNATIDAANKLINAMRKPDGTYRSYEEIIVEGILTRYEGSYSTAGRYEKISENTGAGEGKCDQNFVAYITCVEVEEAIGEVSVVRVRSAADIGVIGNYLALEGQALGGLEHSIGYDIDTSGVITTKQVL